MVIIKIKELDFRYSKKQKKLEVIPINSRI